VRGVDGHRPCRRRSNFDRRREDDKRTQFLEAAGWLVLRFWNTVIDDDLEAVKEMIDQTCTTRTPPPPPPRPQQRRSRVSQGECVLRFSEQDDDIFLDDRKSSLRSYETESNDDSCLQR
jgi:hypothetical protein